MQIERCTVQVDIHALFVVPVDKEADAPDIRRDLVRKTGADIAALCRLVIDSDCRMIEVEAGHPEQHLFAAQNRLIRRKTRLQQVPEHIPQRDGLLIPVLRQL